MIFIIMIVDQILSYYLHVQAQVVSFSRKCFPIRAHSVMPAHVHCTSKLVAELAQKSSNSCESITATGQSLLAKLLYSRHHGCPHHVLWQVRDHLCNGLQRSNSNTALFITGQLHEFREDTGLG